MSHGDELAALAPIDRTSTRPVMRAAGADARADWPRLVRIDADSQRAGGAPARSRAEDVRHLHHFIEVPAPVTKDELQRGLGDTIVSEAALTS